MKVQSLWLENIKRHRGLKAFESLADGVLLLLGRNGRGKTTVPQSIGLAVFGAIPKAFRGSAGRSMVGFITTGETQGRIDAVVEILPGEVVTYRVQLKERAKGAKTKKEPTTEVRYWVYAGRVERDAEPATALLEDVGYEDVVAFTQSKLQTSIDVETLFDTLLSPPQSGGLTAYLDKTPGERQTQTEKMLGLTDVKDVAALFTAMVSALKNQADPLTDAVAETLARGTGQWPELAVLEGLRGTKKRPFEALSAHDVHAAAAAARAPMCARLIEVSRALMLADREVAKWEAKRKRAQDGEAAVREVEAAHGDLARARTALKEAEDAGEKAKALAPRREKWVEANALHDALAEQAAERAAKRAAIVVERKPHEDVITGVDARVGGRESRREALAAAAAAAAKNLEEREAAFADWPARKATADTELERAQEQVTDLEVLRQLNSAAAGVSSIADLETKLAQLRGGLDGDRLPAETAPLVEQLEASLAGHGPAQSADGWDTRIEEWIRRAKNAVQGGQNQQSALAKEEQSIADAREADVAQAKKRNAELDDLAREETTDAALREAAKNALDPLNDRAKALEKRFEGLETKQADAQARRTDPDLVKANDEWIVANEKAGEVEARSEAVTTRLTDLQARIDVLPELGRDLPAKEDAPGWTALREALSEAAQAADAERTQAMADRNGQERQHAEIQHEFGALAEQVERILAAHDKLQDNRASHTELDTLNTHIVKKLSAAVASRVVESVSAQANDFFQQLFVQPAEPTQLVWDPMDYEVTLERNGDRLPAKRASGGEKMATGIALNLALIHFMAPQARWLVLDEPTASLDEENRGGLRDFVETLREPGQGEGRIFDQLLFISHESKLFEGLGDALIFDDDGEDGEGGDGGGE